MEREIAALQYDAETGAPYGWIEEGWNAVFLDDSDAPAAEWCARHGRPGPGRVRRALLGAR